VTTRLGLTLGLLVAVAVAAWWMGASRIAIEQAADAAVLASQALFVLACTRAALLVLLGTRSGLVLGYRNGVRASVPVVAAAWPVVALAWAASSDSLARTLLVETSLLACAVAVPALGHALRHVLRLEVRR
jgi:hypothetical protein